MGSISTKVLRRETGATTGPRSAEEEKDAQLFDLRVHPDNPTSMASRPEPSQKQEDGAEASTTSESDTEGHSDTSGTQHEERQSSRAELPPFGSGDSAQMDGEEEGPSSEEQQDSATAEASAAASAADEAARLREEARDAKRRREAEKRRERTKRRNILQRCTCMQCTFESLQAGGPCPGRACPICLTVPARKSAVAVFRSQPGTCDSHGVCWGCMRHWIEVTVLEQGSSAVRCPGEGCCRQLTQENLIQALDAAKPRGTMATKDQVMQRREELQRVDETGVERLLQVIKQVETDDEARTLMDTCQICPSCLRFVERSTGCRCMSCRCGKGFCYECGQDLGSACICATYEEFRNVGGPTLGLWMALHDSSPEELNLTCRASLKAAILPRLQKEVEVRAEALGQEKQALLSATEEIAQQREAARQKELKEAAEEEERKAAAALAAAGSRKQRESQRRRATKAARSKNFGKAAEASGSASSSSSSDAAPIASLVLQAPKNSARKAQKRGGKRKEVRASNPPEVTGTNTTTEAAQSVSSSAASTAELRQVYSQKHQRPRGKVARSSRAGQAEQPTSSWSQAAADTTQSATQNRRRNRRAGRTVDPVGSAGHPQPAGSPSALVACADSRALRSNRNRHTLVWVAKKSIAE